MLRAFQAAGGCDAGDQCPDIHPWPRALSIGNAIACGLAGYLRTAPITVEGCARSRRDLSDLAASSTICTSPTTRRSACPKAITSELATRETY